jgi:hypothetical protein
MKILIVMHWVAFAAFTWIFGYAGLYKVLKVPAMMEGMASMGFHESWTLAIGWAEVIGVVGLLASMFYPPMRSLAVLWLLPFGIGAFTAHMSYHHVFPHYLNAMLVCVLPIILLWTDRHFHVHISF